MRKVISAAFVSLDGVMQAPGGPEEDPEGGFEYGGWTASYWDEEFGRGTAENYGRPYDLLLGRKTYEIWAGYWPHVNIDPGSSTFNALMATIANTFNDATKYVATRSERQLQWRNSQWLGQDAVAGVRQLKASDGPDLLTQGSSNLIQSLLAADLIDEVRLLIYPLTLGKGKRLFGEGAIPAAFKLTRSAVSSSGVIVASYERAGAIQTGSFELETPTS
jgi:dihydrofolate reductase